MEAPPPLKEEDLDRPEPLMLDPTLEHQVQWADVVAKFCKELRPVHPEGSIFDINQMEFIPSEEKDKLKAACKEALNDAMALKSELYSNFAAEAEVRLRAEREAQEEAAAKEREPEGLRDHADSRAVGDRG